VSSEIAKRPSLTAAITIGKIGAGIVEISAEMGKIERVAAEEKFRFSGAKNRGFCNSRDANGSPAC
jgi:hypothetical protein